jgi:small subunit ribosomal protein S3
MGKKSNAIGSRLGQNQKWKSSWHGEKRVYKDLLHRDFHLQDYLTSFYEGKGYLLADFFLERSHKQTEIKILLFAKEKALPLKAGASPQQILPFLSRIEGGKVSLKVLPLNGKKNNGRPSLLQRQLGAYRFRPYFKEGLQAFDLSLRHRSAGLLAKYISQELGKHPRHYPFLDFVGRSLRLFKEKYPSLQGLRVEVKGRLQASARSRKYSLRLGRNPLQTLSQQVDYRYQPAFTPYGVCGVHIWLFFKNGGPKRLKRSS